MAILRSQDGKLFEVPDEALQKFELSPTKVKALGGATEQEQLQQPQEQQPQQQQQQQLNLPASGEITINLNFGGAPPQGTPSQQAEGEQQPAGAKGDVQGHGWAIYANRYWAYRNQYWAYRNHY